LPSVSSIIASPLDLVAAVIPGLSRSTRAQDGGGSDDDEELTSPRPEFVYEHPYVSSSYYTSTKSIQTLIATEDSQVIRNLRREAEEAAGMDPSSTHGKPKTRLAIVRPFCEFDAEALPTTFTCWNALPPCKAASADVGEADYEDDGSYEVGPKGTLMSYNSNSTVGRALYEDFGDRHLFDLVGSDAMKNAKADVFLFYSQTFSENDVAIKAVDTIIDQFFEPGGWSQCFDNIYAIEANIPQELDLYIPSAQEELYNWVNGPNRQFEAAFRIIQSGEWGEYDGFYLMEGDSVPIKAHWLDVVLSEIEVNRPFAILGAQYDGDKWDNFYEKIPISLLHHTNGNAIYNTSHPLLERLVGQLEVEAPCPYNSIPYDYRMSQMWVEGTLGIVPELAPKIMLNEEGENITLSDNLRMFKGWADSWEKEDPFKYTPVIHNYAATNLIPRHLGPEYIIHGAKLYSPWDPTKSEVTLVVSEWFFDRSLHLIEHLDEKDHPFSEVVIMVPPVAGAHDDYYQLTDVPVRTQHRGAPDFMDLCEADVNTDWFMITNSYHHVARHVDLMFTPGTFKPVIPFTPATYPFCFKFPYCKETVNLAQRINPGQDKVIQDMDILYNTKARNAFCKEWKEENGEEGEDLYKNQQRRLMFRKKIIGPPGPTGTSYYAWLVREKMDGMYKMTDRSLYGARPPFVKVFAKEEKLDGMSEDELAKRVGMTLLDNSTDCNCGALETEVECADSGIGCIWRPLFESCHPPELIDGGEPICATTEAPTMAPTLPLPFDDSESPTSSPTVQDTLAVDDPWYSSVFKSREHNDALAMDNVTLTLTLMSEDDDAVSEETDSGSTQTRKLETDTHDYLYETNRNAEDRGRELERDANDPWVEPSEKGSLKANILDPSEETTRNAAEQSGSAQMRKSEMDTHDAWVESPENRKLEADTSDPWYEQTLDDSTQAMKLETGTHDTWLERLEPYQGKKLEVDTQDPWYKSSESAQQPTASTEARRIEAAARDPWLETPPHQMEVDTQEPWYKSNKSAQQPSASTEARRIEAAARDPWLETPPQQMDVDTRDPWYNGHEHDHTSTFNNENETISMEEMLQEELRLEAVLRQQDKKKEQKSSTVSNLRKEELHYQSEILRLEMLLESIEMEATLLPSKNLRADSKESNEF